MRGRLLRKTSLARLCWGGLAAEEARGLVDVVWCNEVAWCSHISSRASQSIFDVWLAVRGDGHESLQRCVVVGSFYPEVKGWRAGSGVGVAAGCPRRCGWRARVCVMCALVLSEFFKQGAHVAVHLPRASTQTIKK